jgi:hypothetical protein
VQVSKLVQREQVPWPMQLSEPGESEDNLNQRQNDFRHSQSKNMLTNDT